MRTGTQDRLTMLDDDGNLIGFCLGWDFTAEHEWGISRIERNFGIRGRNREVLGVEARQITTDGPLYLDDYVHVLISNNYFKPKHIDSYVRDLPLYGKDEMASAWSESDFGIRLKEDPNGHLKELSEAFSRKDIAIWLGGGGKPFSNAGLVIAIVSRVPEEHREIMRQADEDHFKLFDAAEATGIEKRLKAADKEWFCLSPRWGVGGVIKKETEHPVVFWLNPREQNKHKAGWVTVEELDQWIDGEGPVLK